MIVVEHEGLASCGRGTQEGAFCQSDVISVEGPDIIPRTVSISNLLTLWRNTTSGTTQPRSLAQTSLHAFGLYWRPRSRFSHTDRPSPVNKMFIIWPNKKAKEQKHKFGFHLCS